MPTTPISSIKLGADALQKALDAVLGIPTGKQGQLAVDASTQGAQISVAQKIKWGKVTGDAGLWAGVDWTGMYAAGARLRAAW